VFYLGASRGPLKERGQPYMQFMISYGKWDPHLRMGYQPTNPNYRTSAMSRYGRTPESQIHLQIPVLGM
jgi:hypothetical protein